MGEIMDRSPHAAATTEYAALHRRAESGLADDATWRRLAAVCIVLGKRKEATGALHHIQNPSMRRGLRRDLARLGWVRAQNETVTEADLRRSPLERVRDAAAFLLDGRALWLTLLLTTTFPLVMAVGGLLGAAHVAVQVVATIAALGAFGILAALARHVFLLGLRDVQDAEQLPTVPRLLREAPRMLLEFGPLMAFAMLPPAAAFALDEPIVAWSWLAVAALLVPMVAAQRLCGARWKQLTPATVVRAVYRTRTSYATAAGLIAVLLAPSVAVLLATIHAGPFLSLSLAGPLFAAPFLVAARMLGLTMRDERGALGDLALAVTAAPPARARRARLARARRVAL